MATSNNWNQIGEDILNSVLDAVESGDFIGLSQSVGAAIGEAAASVRQNAGQARREFERSEETQTQTQTLKQTIYEQQAQARRNLDATRPQTQPGSQPNRQTRVSRPQPAQPPARYRRILPGQAGGPILLTMGIIFTTFFGVSALITAGLTTLGMPLGLPVGLGIGALPFIFMIVKGARLTGRNSRFRRYVREIGNRGYCKIEDLARAVGKKTGYVKRDLQDMLENGYFLEGHMDSAQTTLIVDHETYVQYEQAERSRQLREQQEATLARKQADCPDKVRKILAEGQAYINHIHECNDAIPGEVMSAKLERLEDLTRRIFAQVEKQPECADDLRKLMTYYLPTTTKLIDAYRDLDGQPEYGENIANTKKEIEDTLDTINEAFEKLFDGMFENTAWDISSDISTMKVMLEQEGLTDKKDFT